MVEGPAATPAPTVQATAPAPVEAAAPVVGVEEREMGGAVLPGAVTGAEIEAEELANQVTGVLEEGGGTIMVGGGVGEEPVVMGLGQDDESTSWGGDAGEPDDSGGEHGQPDAGGGGMMGGEGGETLNSTADSDDGDGDGDDSDGEDEDEDEDEEDASGWDPDDWGPMEAVTRQSRRRARDLGVPEAKLEAYHASLQRIGVETQGRMPTGELGGINLRYAKEQSRALLAPFEGYPVVPEEGEGVLALSESTLFNGLRINDTCDEVVEVVRRRRMKVEVEDGVVTLKTPEGDVVGDDQAWEAWYVDGGLECPVRGGRIYDPQTGEPRTDTGHDYVLPGDKVLHPVSKEPLRAEEVVQGGEPQWVVKEGEAPPWVVKEGGRDVKVVLVVPGALLGKDGKKVRVTDKLYGYFRLTEYVQTMYDRFNMFSEEKERRKWLKALFPVVKTTVNGVEGYYIVRPDGSVVTDTERNKWYSLRQGKREDVMRQTLLLLELWALSGHVPSHIEFQDLSASSTGTPGEERTKYISMMDVAKAYQLPNGASWDQYVGALKDGRDWIVGIHENQMFAVIRTRSGRVFRGWVGPGRVMDTLNQKKNYDAATSNAIKAGRHDGRREIGNQMYEVCVDKDGNHYYYDENDPPILTNIPDVEMGRRIERMWVCIDTKDVDRRTGKPRLYTVVKGLTDVRDWERMDGAGRAESLPMWRQVEPRGFNWQRLGLDWEGMGYREPPVYHNQQQWRREYRVWQEWMQARHGEGWQEVVDLPEILRRNIPAKDKAKQVRQRADWLQRWWRGARWGGDRSKFEVIWNFGNLVPEQRQALVKRWVMDGRWQEVSPDDFAAMRLDMEAVGIRQTLPPKLAEFTNMDDYGQALARWWGNDSPRRGPSYWQERGMPEVPDQTKHQGEELRQKAEAWEQWWQGRKDHPELVEWDLGGFEQWWREAEVSDRNFIWKEWTNAVESDPRWEFNEKVDDVNGKLADYYPFFQPAWELLHILGRGEYWDPSLTRYRRIKRLRKGIPEAWLAKGGYGRTNEVAWPLYAMSVWRDFWSNYGDKLLRVFKVELTAPVEVGGRELTKNERDEIKKRKLEVLKQYHLVREVVPHERWEKPWMSIMGYMQGWGGFRHSNEGELDILIKAGVLEKEKDPGVEGGWKYRWCYPVEPTRPPFPGNRASEQKMAEYRADLLDYETKLQEYKNAFSEALVAIDDKTYKKSELVELAQARWLRRSQQVLSGDYGYLDGDGKPVMKDRWTGKAWDKGGNIMPGQLLKSTGEMLNSYLLYEDIEIMEDQSFHLAFQDAGIPLAVTDEQWKLYVEGNPVTGEPPILARTMKMMRLACLGVGMSSQQADKKVEGWMKLARMGYGIGADAFWVARGGANFGNLDFDMIAEKDVNSDLEYRRASIEKVYTANDQLITVASGVDGNFTQGEYVSTARSGGEEEAPHVRQKRYFAQKVEDILKGVEAIAQSFTYVPEVPQIVMGEELAWTLTRVLGKFRLHVMPKLKTLKHGGRSLGIQRWENWEVARTDDRPQGFHPDEVMVVEGLGFAVERAESSGERGRTMFSMYDRARAMVPQMVHVASGEVDTRRPGRIDVGMYFLRQVMNGFPQLLGGGRIYEEPGLEQLLEPKHWLVKIAELAQAGQAEGVPGETQPEQAAAAARDAAIKAQHTVKRTGKGVWGFPAAFVRGAGGALKMTVGGRKKKK